MKKSAILLDGEFFSIALRHYLRLLRRPTAEEIYAAGAFPINT
jgi:hypothetical protein